MKLIFFIAKRYLFSKKHYNAINVITSIAGFGIAVGTMALIVLMSAFNGLETTLLSLYDAFDPDIKITSTQGKTFDQSVAEKLKTIEGIAYFAKVVEDNALVDYEGQQHIATIKGVDEHFAQVINMDTLITDGNFVLKDDTLNLAILGYGIANKLNVNTLNPLRRLLLYVPRADASTTNFTTASAFTELDIIPYATFSVQPEIDDSYIFVPIDFAQKLFDYKNVITTIEVKLAKNADQQKVKTAIQIAFGSNFEVKDRFEQHALSHKILLSERLAVIIILSFILLIASFNLIGALTMLILEKQKDIFTLSAMGLTLRRIKIIFVTEAMLIVVLGSLLGLTLGTIFCYLQQTFGIIKVADNPQAPPYPIVMETADYFIVVAIVWTLGLLLAWLPTRHINVKNR